MSRRRLTEAEEREIEEELASGTAIADIAAKLGISPRTVYRRKADRTKPPYEATIAPNQARARLNDSEVIKSITHHLGDLTDSERIRVAHQIADLAQRIFGRPGRRRPIAAAQELNKARDQLQLLFSDLDQMGEDTWMFVLPDVLWKESEYRKVLRRLLKALHKASTIAHLAQQVSGKAPSGRYRDPRIGQFITALAVIYLRTTIKPPHHTTDTKTGFPKSEFNKFVQACIRIFVPYDISWTAIRELMRLVTTINWDELIRKSKP